MNKLKILTLLEQIKKELETPKMITEELKEKLKKLSDNPVFLEDLEKEDWNVQIDDNVAIRGASRSGHLEIVKLLIEAGADATAMDNYCIRYASRNGHKEIVKLLIEAGADVKAMDNYAIRRASENGHFQIVELLIENGADITACRNYTISNASRLVKLLVKHL